MWSRDHVIRSLKRYWNVYKASSNLLTHVQPYAYIIDGRCWVSQLKLQLIQLDKSSGPHSLKTRQTADNTWRWRWPVLHPGHCNVNHVTVAQINYCLTITYRGPQHSLHSLHWVQKCFRLNSKHIYSRNALTSLIQYTIPCNSEHFDGNESLKLCQQFMSSANVFLSRLRTTYYCSPWKT